MNYTISNDTDNYILKGYLYKRGVKDELVWYKRWFVLYHGSLWYWKSRHFQIDPTEIPLANAKLRRSPIAKKNRFMRLAFEIETPRRVYYLRGLTANTNNNLTSKSTKAIEKEHYDNFLKCFWNPDYGFEKSKLINYDWYAPSNAKRYNKDEFMNLLSKFNLKVDFLYEAPECFSGRFFS